jgi:co-chaperonin GroES (HSP10)
MSKTIYQMKPLHDFIFIKPTGETPVMGNLLVPPSFAQKHKTFLTGEVIAFGEEAEDDIRDIKIGDKVLYDKHGQHEVSVMDQTIHVIRPINVHAIEND